MFCSMAGKAVLSLSLVCAGDAVPIGANAVLLLLFRYRHQTWRYFSASGFRRDLGWADTLKIKKMEK